MKHWNEQEKFALRAALIFALISIIPLDLEYLSKITALPWGKLTYVDVDLISNYYPWFVDDKGMGTDYAGLLLAIGISLLGALTWTLADKRQRNYDRLYYWTRVIIRYKVAGVMFYFAFVKVFPVQMPFPSLSQMNTLVGDYTPGRLFWITTGAAPFYEIFSGLAEMLGTVLLLFRRTSTLGAIVLITILLPVVALNIGYDAGIQVKALLILILALILLAENAHSLWNFLVRQKTAVLKVIRAPILHKQWQRNIRLAVKIAFISFFMIFRGYSVASSFFTGKSYKLPEGTGLPQWRGLYDVKEFAINGKSVPYTTQDSTRWQNVIFERWNTISIKDGQPVKMSVANSVRKTEIHANGGRHYYAYVADTMQQTLTLKSRADTSVKLSLHYVRLNETEVLLNGVNEHKDSVRVLLHKIDRTYPLLEKKADFVYRPY